MKHTLTLYTQPNCMYCEMMKSKLDRWGYKSEIVNIQLDEQAKAFIVLDRGRKTAPQLYYGCLLYTSPSPRDRQKSRMPSSA